MNWWAVLLAWLVFYALLYAYSKIRSLPHGLSLSGPIIMWRSRYGLGVVDQLAASYRRFWSVWGAVGLATAFGGLVLSVFMIAAGTLQIFLSPGEAADFESPRNVLVIPGVNDFLPLAAAPELVLGLLIGMVIHEGGHAIMCRLADIDIESTGLFFFLAIPMGAFVEPDEESQNQADRPSRLRMLAAGIMNNTVFAVLALLLLLGPIAGAIVTAPGAPVGGVLPDSPADDAGIVAGDRITAVDGTSVSDADELEAVLEATDSETFTVTLDGESEATVTRSVFITSVVESAPDAFELGTRIVAVNGHDVVTASEYWAAVRESDGELTVTLDSGETVTVEPGVEVRAQSGMPLAAAGIPTDTTVTVTDVNGRPVYSADGIARALGEAAGETVTVTAVVDGNAQVYEATLAENGLLGVDSGAGTVGITVSDFGTRYYPSETYLSAIQFNGEVDITFIERLVLLVVLPLASIVPGVVFDFPGFTPFIQNFYEVTGVAGGFATAWFFLASVLYWSAWVNINLALFNCLPTYALDGGHIFRDTVDELAVYIPGLEPHDETTDIVKAAVLNGTLLMLIALLLSPFIIDWLL